MVLLKCLAITHRKQKKRIRLSWNFLKTYLKIASSDEFNRGLDVIAEKVPSKG